MDFLPEILFCIIFLNLLDKQTELIFRYKFVAQKVVVNKYKIPYYWEGLWDILSVLQSESCPCWLYLGCFGGRDIIRGYGYGYFLGFLG